MTSIASFARALWPPSDRALKGCGRFSAVRVLAATIAAIGCLMVVAGSASAAPTVGLTSSFAEGTRLGEGGLASERVELAGAEYHGAPLPLDELTIRTPKGTTLTNTGLATCSKATLEHSLLERSGPSGCPVGSQAWEIGSFSGFVAFGTEYVAETGFDELFFDPAGGVELYLRGVDPVGFSAVAHGEYLPPEGAGGPAIKFQVPEMEPDPVPGSPDVSVESLTVPLGAFHEHEGIRAANLVAPSACSPTARWSASVTVSDRKGGEAAAGAETTSSCPGSGSRTSSSTSLDVAKPTAAEYEANGVTASVVPASASASVPSGLVALHTDEVTNCGALTLVAVGVEGRRSCEFSFPSAGPQRIEGFYLGDSTFAPSEAPPVTVTVLTEEEAAAKHKAEAEEAAKRHTEEEAAARRQSEEAATAKRYAEEAAAKARPEAEARGRSEPEPTPLKVVIAASKVSPRGITLVIRLSTRSKVVVSGPGLKRVVKTLAPGSSRLVVPFTKLGASLRSRHKTIRITVAATAGSQSAFAHRPVRL